MRAACRPRFPRLQKRGPIEALRRPAEAPRDPRRFHAYKSVAPLKHHGGGRPSGVAEDVSTLTKAWPH